MADINVERKGPSIWPWIIGLIILALLIWWFVSRSGTEQRVVPATTPDTAVIDTTVGMMTPPGAPPTTEAGAVPEAVEEYVTFVASTEAQADAGRQHQYVSDGLERLANALEAAAERGTGAADVSAAVDRIRQRADQLGDSDWNSAQHANMVRDAFTTATAAMREVGSTHFAAETSLNADLEQMSDAANAIQPDAPLLEQKERVQTFFNSARDALVAMAAAPVD